MKLEHLLEQDNHEIEEALGRWGTIAALGMLGMGGVNAMSGTTSQLGNREILDLTPPQSAQVSPASPHVTAQVPVIHPPDAPIKRRPDSYPATSTPSDLHPNFPEALHTVADYDANRRVNTFVHVMLPLIQSENARIAQMRARAQRIMAQRTLTAADTGWLQDRMEAYGADSPRELLRRMDQVPASLVLAQSAIESGWGTDRIARTANAFFGQKAVRSQTHVRGDYGERYRSYESPAHSIRSYMHNLNTHAAYEDLRNIRARLRARGQTPQGIDLAAGLERYSTRGEAYVRQVQQLIRSRRLNTYDR